MLFFISFLSLSQIFVNFLPLGLGLLSGPSPEILYMKFRGFIQKELKKQEPQSELYLTLLN